jgi:GcrA cell cycle regulator
LPDHWTTEKTSELIDMVINGDNTKLIAEHFGCLPGAVASKIARLRKSGSLPATARTKTTKEETKSKPKTQQPKNTQEATTEKVTKPSPKKVNVVTEPVEIEPEPVRVKPLHPLERLGHRDCRWPLGDPRVPGFKWCGKKIEPNQNGPYCKEHHQIAFSSYSRAVVAAE